MAEKIPGSKFVSLPRCGHNPFQERPEDVLPQIMEFLQRNHETPPAEAGSAEGHGNCNLVHAEL